jgi:hypothetical protein
MAEPTLEPCPYPSCGKQHLTVSGWSSSPADRWHVCCLKCGACGPWLPDRLEAIRQWNRVSRLCSRPVQHVADIEEYLAADRT